jgi:hypothetical protein
MHAYPIFLTAAAYAVVRGVTLLASLRNHRQLPVPSRNLMAACVVTGLLLAGAYLAYQILPYFVLREGILAGESTSVEAGERDRVFFVSGWSAPRTEGLVTARVTQGPRGVIRIPLPEARQYSLILRLDPVSSAKPSSVSLLLNRNLLGHLRLSLDPSRVGSYRISLPRNMARVGRNELVLVADETVPAGGADPRYRWMDPSTPIAIRLWYVRVLPEGGS